MYQRYTALIQSCVSAAVLAAVVLLLLLPGSVQPALAQEGGETTAEPAPSESPAPTEEPEADDEAAAAAEEAPAEEADDADETGDADEEEPAAELTPEATAPPAETGAPETPGVLNEDFEEWMGEGWLLSGWEVVTEEENSFLQADEAAATAAVIWPDLANMMLSADLRIEASNTASVHFRAGAESYSVMFDTHGNSRLYRGSDLLQAAPAPPAADEDESDTSDEAAWFTAGIQAVSGVITVSVNGEPVMQYSDPDPLVAGNVVFQSGVSNTGSVALDNVSIVQVTAVLLTPEPAAPTATEEPADTAPEVTDEPEATDEAEADETPAAEVTEEPEAADDTDVSEETEETPAPEVTDEPEATEAPEAALSIDFQGEVTDWELGPGASIVSVDDGDMALLLAGGGWLAPMGEVSLSDFSIEGRLNILTTASADSSLRLYFRETGDAAYVLGVGPSGAALWLADGEESTLLAEAEAALSLSTWHSFTLAAQGGQISLLIDGAEVLTYSDESALEGGSFRFVAGGETTLMLDNVVVRELAAAAEASATPTPTSPLGEMGHKAIGPVADLLESYLNNNTEAYEQLLAEMEIETDELGRVRLVVWSMTGQDAAGLVSTVESVGGVVTSAGETSVQAFLPPASIVPLIHLENVAGITLPLRATSTGPLEGPVGTGETEGFDYVGAQPWHLAGVTGQNVRVAVIDTGFVGPKTGADYSCLGSTAVQFGGEGAGNHGLNVVQVICDVAPGSRVFMYRATDADSLHDAINAAMSNNIDIILITMDLGAAASPGDGTFGRPAAKDPYAAIQNAHDAGIVVVAAAGNNNGSYVTIEFNGTSTTVNVTGSSPELVNVSWSSWGGGARPNISTSGLTTVISPGLGGDPRAQYSMSGNCNPCTLTFNGYAEGGGTVYIQVQATGLTSTATTASPLATTGSMARPADSPHVIAVGAVCANYEANMPLLPYSSRGPAFGSGGTPPSVGSPPFTRDRVKPEIVAPAHVSTSLVDADPLLCTGGSNFGGGFGGTSSASAHVAGMVALLMSNVNNTSMAEFSYVNNTSAAAVTAVKNYLQTHAYSVNGFTMNRGAGIVTLGNPSFDLNTVQNHPALPDTSRFGDECTGNVVYVGQGNLGDTVMDGSIDHPWVHPAYALATATANTCIVVMPGEYVTPLNVDGVPNNVRMLGYDNVTRDSYAPSIFRVNLVHHDTVALREAGVYINNGSNAFTISGFDFQPSRRYDFAFMPEITAFSVNGSQNVIIRDSIFDGYSFNGAQAIEVLSGSHGIRIEGNTFSNSTGTGVIPTVTIASSGTSGNRAVVIANQFLNNSVPISPQAQSDWGAILYATNSYIDIINNAFVGNTAETIVQTRTTSDTAVEETRVLGNVFLNNTAATSELASNTGPLVNLYHVPRFYFINNTVVGNNLTQSGLAFGAIVGRGDNTANNLGTPPHGSILDGRWEVHNNLFYHNIAPLGVVKDLDVNNINCRNIAGTNNAGAQYNWFWRQGGGFTVTASGGDGGDCSVAMFNDANTIRNVDPTEQFLGFIVNNDGNPDTGFSSTDWRYYAFSVDGHGLDIGSNTLANVGGGGLIEGADFLLDVSQIDRGNTRRADGDQNGSVIIDIGAFEYVPITITNDPYIITFVEDTGTPYQIDLRTGPDVQGGFGQLTFSIVERPNNWGTQCGPQFVGQRGLVLGTGANNDKASYCPGRHFYNWNGGLVHPQAAVIFAFRVTDESGAYAEGEVEVRITPQADVPLGTDAGGGLGTGFGDGNPETDVYSFSANINSTIDIPLRPYVRFGNFFFSEANNPEFMNQADYPFAYGGIVVTEDDPGAPIVNSFQITTNANGVPVLRVTTTDSKGTATITYGVDEGTSFSAPADLTGTIRLRAVSTIPDEGLYDDSSFAFTYSDAAGNIPGGWRAEFNGVNINGTLHSTAAIGDRASFRFIGTGFVLYMQGNLRGGTWRLTMEDNLGNNLTLGEWAQDPDSRVWQASILSGITPIADAACTTTAPTNGNLISNLGRDPYRVTCNGLTGVVQGPFTVTITNMEARTLSVDAFSIMKETSGLASSDPLPPGFHDVDSVELYPLFDGDWYEIADRGSSNLLARATTTTATFSFSFRGGYGFALGTVIERAGAEYTICVEPRDLSTTPVCQSFDNSPNNYRLGAIWNVFRPFYGFDPSKTYDVTVTVTDVPVDGLIQGRMVIDSVVVFPTTMKADDVLPLGQTENDRFTMFVTGGGLPNSWLLDTANVRASNRSLTSLNRGIVAAGPFISFQIPEAADVFHWAYNFTRRESTQLMICVDRALGAGGNHGNCIVVDTRIAAANPQVLPQYQVQQADGTLTPGTEVIQTVDGVLVIHEGLFRAPWAASGQPHTVEIFSMTNEGFNFDLITVVDSSGPLAGGYYEDYTRSFAFYTAADLTTPVTPVLYDRINNNYVADFTLVPGRFAPRDSGRSVIQTSGMGNAVFFSFTGTGFAPHFRVDRTSAAVRVCWLSHSVIPNPTPQQVIDNTNDDTCQTFNNNDTRAAFQVARTVTGLAPDTYSVLIRTLDSQQMWFDGVAIYDDDWSDAAVLNVLTPGQRYEGSYINRLANRDFLYYGTGWTSFEGARARNQSAQNYDQIRVPGASIVLHTNNADAIVLYRDLRRGYSPVMVCASPVGPAQPPRKCTLVSNDGTGFQQPVTVYLNDTGATGPHVVTITTQTSAIFIFDAVELFDTSAPLTAGTYDDTYPGLVYESGYQNLIVNGGMEVNGTWTPIGASTTNQQNALRRYEGRFGWRVVAAAAGAGIQSNEFTFVDGQRYTIIGRVWVETASGGTVTMRDTAASFTPATTDVALNGRWQTLRVDYTHSGADALTALEFVASEAGVDFHVDDVFVNTGATWASLFNRAYYGGGITRSQTHGASMSFRFTGTGFEVGTILDRDGGEYEICYGATGTEFCFVYQNESVRVFNTVSRTVVGLPMGTYTVIIRDVEDGYTVTTRLNPNAPRLLRNSVGTLAVDYVRIFNESLPPVIAETGTFNEDARIGGVQGLQLLPAHRWGRITGTPARNYSEGSFFTIVDDLGRLNRTFGGPVGAIQLDLVNNDQAIVILNLGVASRQSSDQLLACIDHVDGVLDWDGLSFSLTSDRCALINTMPLSPQVVMSAAVPGLEWLNNANDPAPNSNHVLTFRTLTGGQFDIDGYQVLYDNVLTEGFYEETVGDALNPAGIWTKASHRSYSAGEALVSSGIGSGGSSIEFVMEGTGFSLLTEFGRTSGTVNIEITSGSFSATYNNVSLYDAAVATRYSSLTYAGLPFNTYTVTITKVGDDGRLVVDAISVQGALQTLGSLYDDADTDLDGNLLITYGPKPNSWVSQKGTAARNHLNETYHETREAGAFAAFQVGTDTTGIVIYYSNRSTSTAVEVCWTETTGNFERVCEELNFNDNAGRKVISKPVGLTDGPFQVSITNLVHARVLNLDAVQVIKNELVEGIYQEDFNTNWYNGSWTIASDTASSDRLAVRLGPNATMEFQFEGIAFAIVLSETTSTSTNYQLCVNTGTSTSGGTQCNTVGATGTSPMNLTRIASPRGLFALGHGGLHSGGGGNGTYSVYLRNTGTADLVVDRIEILGANSTLRIDGPGLFEDVDPRMRYFPFGSMLEVNTRRGEASDNNQHIGSMRGSMSYFEFSDSGGGGPQPAFDYVRQISTRYGSVEICYGRIGTDNSFSVAGTRCTVVDNNTNNLYQVPQSIAPAPGTYCADGCWVTIRNLNDASVALDYIRTFDISAPLAGGFYEDSHPTLSYFDAAFDPLVPTDVVDRRASGGGYSQVTTLNGGMSFRFTGTGFSVYFVQDTFADTVNVCWKSGTNTVQDTIETGNCQLFDNYNRRLTFTTGRSILGLAPGTYTVAVQVLDDDYRPAPHTVRELPISMKIDGVAVHGADWTQLNALAAGTRVETSFNHAVRDNNFHYLGSGWTSFEGARARLYSGQNYDQVRQFGSGVVFHTSSANAVTIYRDVRRGYAPLLICATPAAGGATSCTVVTNEGGTMVSVPFTYRFSDTPGAYVVSVSTLTAGIFNLDSVMFSSAPAALTAGTYEATDPGIIYNTTHENLIVNGDMEFNGVWSNVGAPSLSQYYTLQRYSGRSSWRIQGTTGNGIRSNEFLLENGKTYTIIGRVYVELGSVGTVTMRDSAGNFSVSADNTLTRRWQTLRIDYTHTGGDQTVQLQFVASGGQALFNVDDVHVSVGGQWQQVVNARAYTGGVVMRSYTHGAQASFTFTGTGFEVGTVVDRDGGEVEICYGPTGTENCFTYQNESARVNNTTSRTIVGLPLDTYTVIIRDVENGFISLTRNNPNAPRVLRNAVGSVAINYVSIFDDALPPVAEPGFYNEDATNSSGEAYMQFFGTDRWGQVSGRTARTFSNSSYMTVVDHLRRASRNYAGQSALMQVEVPAGGGNLTIVLYTGRPARTNAAQLLVCVDTPTGEINWTGLVFELVNSDDCILTDRMTVDGQVVIDGSMLPALTVPGTHTVSFTSLVTGGFIIDGFQIMAGRTLPPGIFDDFLPETLLDFTPDLYREPRGCNRLVEWCLVKHPRAYGGHLAQTSLLNATLEFSFEGTGFGVVLPVDTRGGDMRICYRPEGGGEFPNPDDNPDKQYFTGFFPDADGDVWCETVTTSGTRWGNIINTLEGPITLSEGRINPRNAFQYGFAYYGLPLGSYEVEIRVVDTALTNLRYVSIDAITVFGSVAQPEMLLDGGLYDNTDSRFLYEPSVFWTLTEGRTSPPRGPWNMTEHTATNAGTLVQMYVEGNAIVVYQTTNVRNTSDARICVLVTSEPVHCGRFGDAANASQMANFSQAGRRIFFTPIVFYGLGDGEHVVIIENRDHARTLSFDALWVVNP